MSRYVFCFPYRGIGGVSILFARLAERLALLPDHEVYVVDYPDGDLNKNVRNPRIGRIVYEDEGTVPIPEDATLVVQSRPDWFFPGPLSIPDSTRLFFWTCYPFNLVPTIPGLRKLTAGVPPVGRAVLATVLRGYRARIVSFIRFLETCHALAFMDEPNVQNTSYYLDMNLREPIYLPIFAGEPRSSKPTYKFDSELRVSWVGRIADFKYPILKYAASALDRVVPDLKISIRLTVVGQGEYLPALRADATKWKNLTVQFINEIAPTALPTFLQDDTDVLMAMGTSALEGASNGVPTILLDPSFADVPDGYVFSWLHERSGYSLGKILSANDFVPGNNSLRNLLQDATDNIEAISGRALSYYKANHAPGMVQERFLQHSSASSCYYRQYREHGFGKPEPLYAAYSAIRRGFLGS